LVKVKLLRSKGRIQFLGYPGYVTQKGDTGSGRDAVSGQEMRAGRKIFVKQEMKSHKTVPIWRGDEI
jgi:hypothetical protein